MADITGDKIRELLSDPKNIELIANIAGSGLLSGMAPAASQAQKEPDDISERQVTAETEEVAAGTDTVSLPENIPALSQISSLPDFSAKSSLGALSGTSDKRIALLKAIKPYVSDSKKERVDGLVKAISLAGVLSGYTGGLFGNKS